MKRYKSTIKLAWRLYRQNGWLNYHKVNDSYIYNKSFFSWIISYTFKYWTDKILKRK